MRSIHWLSLLLILVLVILTPGGSTCLPLPDGQHIHISGVDHEGHETPGLVVFTHTRQEGVKAFSASTAFVAGASGVTLTPDFSPPLPVMSGLFVAPLASLAWILEWAWVRRSQPGPTPPLRPPRFGVTLARSEC